MKEKLIRITGRLLSPSKGIQAAVTIYLAMSAAYVLGAIILKLCSTAH